MKISFSVFQNKKGLLLSLILAFSFLFLLSPQISYTLSGTSCTDQLSGLRRYERCRVNNNDARDIWAEGCSPLCREVINNTGKPIFIPAKTCSEWVSFVTFYPPGITFDKCRQDPPAAPQRLQEYGSSGSCSFSMTSSRSVTATFTGLNPGTIKIQAISNGEYRIGSGVWTTSTTFSGLNSGQTYEFTQRLAETSEWKASLASPASFFTAP